ncbi:hypothetical protein AGMMS49991_08540 [Spirochaetia bacterium]|nr:hypothetical protein AGMMS49991_08540 [Spirochaetia bacterium]
MQMREEKYTSPSRQMVHANTETKELMTRFAKDISVSFTGSLRHVRLKWYLTRAFYRTGYGKVY